VSHARRFSIRQQLPAVARRILHLLPDSYVDLEAAWKDGELDLLDPLLVFENSQQRFERTVPPFFLPVGTADPLLDDTRRMALALSRRGIPNEARYYPGEIHAFHFMTWRPNARQLWQDVFRFVDTQMRQSRVVRIAG
jgi:acetyl esterase